VREWESARVREWESERVRECESARVREWKNESENLRVWDCDRYRVSIIKCLNFKQEYLTIPTRFFIENTLIRTALIISAFDWCQKYWKMSSEYEVTQLFASEGTFSETQKNRIFWTTFFSHEKWLFDKSHFSQIFVENFSTFFFQIPEIDQKSSSSSDGSNFWFRQHFLSKMRSFELHELERSISVEIIKISSRN